MEDFLAPAPEEAEADPALQLSLRIRQRWLRAANPSAVVPSVETLRVRPHVYFHVPRARVHARTAPGN